MALLVRIVSDRKPASVAIVGDRDGLISRTLALADSRLKSASPLSADLTVVDDATADCQVGSPVVVIYNLNRPANHALWQQLTADMTRGMDFTDYLTGVICRYEHLPRQSFSITF